MALDTIPLPYGLRDIKITPYTTLAATTLAASAIDLPNAQTLSWTENEDFTDLRGDDTLVTSHGQGPSISFDLESGGISMEAFAAMAGGTVTTTGVAPNQIKTFSKSATTQRPFFQVVGASISDSGGDFLTVLYRCKITGDIKGEQKDGQFLVPALSGTGYASLVSGTAGKLYDLVQRETGTGEAELA